MSDLVFGPVTSTPAYASLLTRAASGVAASNTINGTKTFLEDDESVLSAVQPDSLPQTPATTLSILYQPPVYPDGRPLTLQGPESSEAAAVYTRAQSAYGAALSLTPSS